MEDTDTEHYIVYDIFLCPIISSHSRCAVVKTLSVSRQRNCYCLAKLLFQLFPSNILPALFSDRKKPFASRAASYICLRNLQTRNKAANEAISISPLFLLPSACRYLSDQRGSGAGRVILCQRHLMPLMFSQGQFPLKTGPPSGYRNWTAASFYLLPGPCPQLFRPRVRNGRVQRDVTLHCFARSVCRPTVGIVRKTGMAEVREEER